MANDIVKQLRDWKRAADGTGLGSLLGIFDEAADEIQRLRVQALGTQRRIQDQDAIMAELWERIHALTTERDEARREVCNLRPSVCLGAQTAVEFANHRGWDCFKGER